MQQVEEEEDLKQEENMLEEEDQISLSLSPSPSPFPSPSLSLSLALSLSDLWWEAGRQACAHFLFYSLAHTHAHRCPQHTYCMDAITLEIGVLWVNPSHINTKLTVQECTHMHAGTHIHTQTHTHTQRHAHTQRNFYHPSGRGPTLRPVAT